MSFEERLKKAFAKRQQSGNWPPFYQFDDEGDTFIGQISGRHDSTYFDADKPLRTFHATDYNTGEEFSLPTVRQVQAAWDSLEVEVGDYVRLEFTGEQKLKKGRGTMKTYNVSKLTEEEFVSIKRGKDTDEEPGKPEKKTKVDDDVITNEFKAKMSKDGNAFAVVKELSKKYDKSIKEIKKLAEKALEETETKTEKPKEKEELASEDVKIRQDVTDALEFAEEMTKETLEKSLAAINVNKPIDEVLELCMDIITIGKDGVIKKK